MSDTIKNQANNAVLSQIHRACVGILEKIEISRDFHTDSSESMAFLRAYIVLFKKWEVLIGSFHALCDRTVPVYSKRFDINDAGWARAWQIILSAEISMIVALSAVEIGIKRPTESDLESFLEVYYWGIPLGYDDEDTNAIPLEKAQTLIQVGYIWKALSYEEFEGNAKRQQLKGLPAQLDYVRRVVEILYGMVPLEELGKDIKQYTLSLVGLLKNLGSIMDGIFHGSATCYRILMCYRRGCKTDYEGSSFARCHKSSKSTTARWIVDRSEQKRHAQLYILV
jgi:hypothetical protein